MTMSEDLLIGAVVMSGAVILAAGIKLYVTIAVWMDGHPIEVYDFKRRLRRFFGRQEKKFELPDNCKKCKARHKCWADAVSTYVKESGK